MALGNAKPTFTCDNCGRRGSGASTTSATGRRLCVECADQLTGAAAGLMASQGAVGDAVATAGWFTALRARRRSRRSPGDSA
ncbi:MULTISPECIES: hypothetical protein [unclassified Pseudofrankia]|uniref:hypothetical protein n=1 Tax=unclassified Pseudofrankia TaxID=2994372 RepID=UPI0008D9BCD2|nr:MULTISPECIES: hypothetical protein [unclassified Pseudofrankia]MDT3440348.1 hypothetical protein [Pseudofrankia sp. BMG5.37]OHV73647.1 hypothetical protein BCD48_33255 [Pseudofrankia sp. BMG5.36]